jgi:hypothetical protein
MNACHAIILVLLGVVTSGVMQSTVCWATQADHDRIVIEDGCAD